MRIDIGLEQITKAIQVAPKLKEFKKSINGIEAMFVKDLLNVMRKSLPKNENAQFGSQIYTDMFDQAIADSVSKNGSFGISESLMRSLAPQFIRAEIASLERDAQLKASQAGIKVYHDQKVNSKTKQEDGLTIRS